MTELEHELRDLLAHEASRAGVGTEDWSDLTRRIGRRRRHKLTVLGGAFAVLLVASATGLALVHLEDGSGPGTAELRSGAGPSASDPGSGAGTSGAGCTSMTTTPAGSAPSTTTTTTAGATSNPGSVCPPSEQPMPRPGVQPAHPSTARTAVKHAFTAAYNGGLALSAASRDAIEGGAALVSLADQVRAGPLGSLTARTSAEVRDVVFTSPTSATVRFDSSMGTEGARVGALGLATFADGRWLVSRDTACLDLRLVGVLCPGYLPLAHNG
jgi:hypothetical protein